MRIAVCDNEPVEAKEIADVTARHMQAFGMEQSTDVYYSSGALLASGELYDLYLLDCKLDTISGIDVARRLRDKGVESAIILVTAYDDYVYEGYEVGAYRYIRKPIDEELFAKTLADYFRSMDKDGYLDFVSDKKIIRLRLSEIMYIESSQKRSIIRHKRGSYETGISSSELESKIKSNAFFRTHRRFVVNMKYIVEVDKNIIRLTNDEKIELSRRNLKSFNSAYMHYLKYSAE